MSNTKYTKELLEQHVPDATSFTDLARRLKIAPVGSNTTNLSNRCKQFNVDTSHFTGQAHQKGRMARNRLHSDEILVLREKENGRNNPGRLRRALVESGIEEKCNECGINSWNDKELRLQVDHINGKYWDNRKHNLQFLCPNCHTQTETWGSKKLIGLVA